MTDGLVRCVDPGTIRRVSPPSLARTKEKEPGGVTVDRTGDSSFANVKVLLGE